MSPWGDGNDVFSPLALYFRGVEFPTEKKGEKTMIGQNGWLECTEQNDHDKKKQTPQKKARILDGIRKIAKDMSELRQGRRIQPVAKGSVDTHVAVSLDPRQQSLLYCELEFHLTTALNIFHGRRQGNTTEIALLLNEMKLNARNMRVRTFCKPDSTIAKHLVDSQSLFNLVNASTSQQIALAEIARFYKLLIK
ncbi:hypothetical protein V8C42DRAFT_244109 [Trichoderma barbatum]